MILKYISIFNQQYKWHGSVRIMHSIIKMNGSSQASPCSHTIYCHASMNDQPQTSSYPRRVVSRSTNSHQFAHRQPCVCFIFIHRFELEMDHIASDSRGFD